MHKLNSRKMLSLIAAGLVAIAVPIVFGQANAAQSQMKDQAQTQLPVYDIASIKPNKSDSDTMGTRYLPDGFRATNLTLQMLIQTAYRVRDDQISGAPKWADSERYDIEAKVDTSVADELQKLSPEQRMLVKRRMLQPILEDRFQLKFHRETKQLPVYWLVVAKAGKLHEAEGDCDPSNPPPPMSEPGKAPTLPCGIFYASGRRIGVHLGGQKVSVTQLVDFLSGFITQRVVLDKTGLMGKYNITLDWTPDQDQFPAPAEGAPNGQPTLPQPDTNGPSLFTALQEQLGLKLVSGKGPVEIIVIDHVERPSEN